MFQQIRSMFENEYRRAKDRSEIERLRYQFGTRAREVVRARAACDGLATRDRAHWRRLAAKM